MQPGLALRSARSKGDVHSFALARTGIWRPQAQSADCRRRELKNGTHGERFGTWCGLPVCTL